MPGPWHRRKGLIAALLTFFILLLVVQTRNYHSPLEAKPPSSPASESHPDPASTAAAAPLPDSQTPSNSLLKAQASFWRNLYQIILNNDPNCNHVPDPVVPQKLDIGFDPTHDHQRPDILYMDAADVKRMRAAHSNFVNDLKNIPPQMPYDAGTRGIVMTGGFNQLPVLVISIRMLRRARSTLPVEVFVAEPSEWDDQICNVVLPSLNAKCLLFSDIFRAADTGVSINRYQFKIMAILFSSFEEVLMLDSDAFPVHNPLPLFEEEPFKTTGMVIWPDFWYASESPYYFEISKIDHIPALNERASVESGELLYSKAKHHMSLMLAAYYNYYGPKYYYPLLSQGAPGQGDKETFAWAATALKEPFYAVHEPVMALGRHDTSGEFLGSAMGQHDPIADYTFTQAHGAPHQRVGEADSSSVVKPFFVHANFPKFDPSTIFDHGGPTRDTNGSNVRCWGGQDQAVKLFGFDAERRFWEEIKATACEYEHQFACWKGKQDICARTQSYWGDVFGSEGTQ